jgi:hypothetical protein
LDAKTRGHGFAAEEPGLPEPREEQRPARKDREIGEGPDAAERPPRSFREQLLLASAAAYLLLIPTQFRRRVIAFGSEDPTRVICSTLIAQAFQSVNYPVLPAMEYRAATTAECPDCIDEIMHIRHHSLFARASSMSLPTSASSNRRLKTDSILGH